MSQNIRCPHCSQEFALENAITNEIESSIKAKYIARFEQDQKAWAEKERQLKEEREKLLLDKEAQERIITEKVKLERQRLAEEARKKVTEELSSQMELLKSDLESKSGKLREAQEKELIFQMKEKELKEKAENFEYELKKQVLEKESQIRKEAEEQAKERAELLLKEKESELARKKEEMELVILKRAQEAAEKVKTEEQMKQAELIKQLDDSKKMIGELSKKIEQKSMQLQGEVQELALEEMLRNSFPFDTITEVAKGVRGADAIQMVRNQFGQECGKIIYESKRTKAFGGDWIEKLKTDMRAQGADIAVLVTEVMPKEMEHFGEKNGVWICTYSEVRALAHVLRDGIIKVSLAARSQENKGDKMHMLYDYLTSNEFSEQWKAIREGFMGMKITIQKERDMMEKLWKAREKQLEKVLLNAAHIRGSIDGIAGQDSIDFNLLDDGSPELLS